MIWWFVVPKIVPILAVIFLFPLAACLAAKAITKIDFWFVFMKILEIGIVATILETFVRAFMVAHGGPQPENFFVAFCLAIIITFFYGVFAIIGLGIIAGIWFGCKLLYRFALNKPFAKVAEWFRTWIKKNARAAEIIDKRGLLGAFKYWMS